MSHSFGTIEEMGEGGGFRKIRRELGITAFGVNAIVYPPGQEGFAHYHDHQDELYFIHSGTARFEVGGEERILGPGGLCHVEATVPRFDGTALYEAMAALFVSQLASVNMPLSLTQQCVLVLTSVIASVGAFFEYAIAGCSALLE